MDFKKKEILRSKLQEYADKNNPELVDFDNLNQKKYCINFSKVFNDLTVAITVHYLDFGQVYFTSLDVANQAIEMFKNDLMEYFTSKKQNTEVVYEG